VLYGTTTGTSKRAATSLEAWLNTALPGAQVVVSDIATYRFDEMPSESVLILMVSTHTEGTPPPSCAHFWTLLQDHVQDFRVGRFWLAKTRFAVVGFGSDLYPQEHFCTPAHSANESLRALGGMCLLPVHLVRDTKDAEPQMIQWRESLRDALQGGLLQHQEPRGAIAKEPEESDVSDSESESENNTSAPAEEVEELADSACATGKVPEMLTKRHRAQLQKEGYQIIGSHSAVKLCRWTKAQMRGRGGCYKHSFYGISSYQCMEATPSLACANKCTFCWRHHKNPVAKEWKWRADEPDMIVREGIELHRKMIKQLKGVPGIVPQRFKEAMNVRHCALSLVGEPIMYPRINEMVRELHQREISTFLVTNAQMPDAIHRLEPITQLYVSVDAATPAALKAIDRPLFSDYWDRFLESLRALRTKQQRTVYRLTLVKGSNMDDPADYARLVELGNPDFIEIKSVTFCGKSDASDMTMERVPWHEEVKQFSEAILSNCGLSEQYEMACEHQHSCIVLIAKKRFQVDGQWHTWIDYPKFHKLVTSGEPFTAMDYMAPTPEWAAYGAREAGFDPIDTRHYHNRTKRKAQEGTLSAVLEAIPHQSSRCSLSPEGTGSSRMMPRCMHPL